jgi:choline dehydrogenase-like flavoprotein
MPMTSGDRNRSAHRDVIVVGSGFGGTMAAWPLVEAGLDVLMLERGAWVGRGPHSWAPEGTVTRTPHYRTDDHYLARTGARWKETTSCSCVGGPSVFYGGVSFRFREGDFAPDPEIVTDSGALWPIAYEDLRPHYRDAERIIAVAGRRGEDPFEPPREGEYPAALDGLSEVSERIAAGARARGLRPFRLPLALNFEAPPGTRHHCQSCATCDTFACAVEAKNDLATRVLPRLLERGLELRPETGVTRILVEGGAVVGVECEDIETGTRYTLTADRVILAAGALGTAHLLLASGLDELNPAGDLVGRYLTRHSSGIVFGSHPWIARHEGRFHKQIGINDYYFGDPAGRGPPGKLGNIQQTQTPSVGTVTGEIGTLAGMALAPLIRRATGLLVMAEDRPKYDNRVYLDGNDRDRFGLPRLRIEHSYDDRDLAARAFLFARAKEVHRAAGALATYVHVIHTFSHALGTVRMGSDPATAPLDAAGEYRGVKNLYVTDGSALPTAAGVNPSLTIAANALRIGRLLASRVGDSAASATKGG